MMLATLCRTMDRSYASPGMFLPLTPSRPRGKLEYCLEGAASRSATNESQYFKALSNNPYLRLVESGGKDVLIRLTGGVLQFYDNNNGVLRSSIDMSTGKWEPALDLNGRFMWPQRKLITRLSAP